MSRAQRGWLRRISGIGNLLAIPQTNIQRMLAYSSIAHAGHTLMALVGYGKPLVAGGCYCLGALCQGQRDGVEVVLVALVDPQACFRIIKREDLLDLPFLIY
jgi:NADH:ubiquinone oxidoreductase subunit 2 (subunit N)